MKDPRAQRRKRNRMHSRELFHSQLTLARIGIPRKPHQKHFRAAQRFAEALMLIPIDQFQGGEA